MIKFLFKGLHQNKKNTKNYDFENSVGNDIASNHDDHTKLSKT